MRAITETKELRSIQLAILDSIVDVCERNGIKYSLAGGTLIGALRHKGYIPWDDDIDLFMMRSEYNKFLKLYNKEQQEAGSPYELKDPTLTDRSYIYTFGKVVDNRTLLIEDEYDDKLGVNVDIFPLDYVNDDEKKRYRQFRVNYFFSKIRLCKLVSRCYLSSKLAFYCYRFLPITVKQIDKFLHRFVYSQGKTSLVLGMHCPWQFYNCAFPAETMDNFTTAEFEGKIYKIMAGYDAYLTRFYKFHYMTLPPEDQRIHHQFKAWWKD